MMEGKNEPHKTSTSLYCTAWFWFCIYYQTLKQSSYSAESNVGWIRLSSVYTYLEQWLQHPQFTWACMDMRLSKLHEIGWKFQVLNACSTFEKGHATDLPGELNRSLHPLETCDKPLCSN